VTGKLPRLRYLRKANTCNYCQKVRGFTHSGFGERERRLHRVECAACGKRHLACFGCADRIGSAFVDGRRKIKACAKRYYWKHVRPRTAANGAKGA